MKLIATPRSHFSRKVRILLDLYKLTYELVDIGNVADTDLDTFAKNPLLKVPCLIDGEHWLIESDHIVSYIVKMADPSDRYEVNIDSVLDLNIRAILNGVMLEEVKIVLGKRTSIPIEQYSFFDKALLSIQNGLDWLELNYPSPDKNRIKYRDIHLACSFEHLDYYKVLDLGKYNHLQKCVEEISKVSAIKATSPLFIS